MSAGGWSDDSPSITCGILIIVLILSGILAMGCILAEMV